MLRRRRGTGKYGVAPKVERTSRSGELFDSKLEMKLAQQLELRKHVIGPDRDRVVDVKRQVSVDLEVNGMLICRYRCDFLVTYADGHEEWTESKGLSTPEWKLKEKLFRALYPERKLVIVRTVR